MCAKSLFCQMQILIYRFPSNWIYFLQHIKTSEFRICLKELFAAQHDPVTVSYVVLAGKHNDDWNKAIII